jgi:glycosyltransferase involved in cell wall biosynthesis
MAHVSVVIPLYNKKPYIQRALNSVLQQTLTDIEVLVVNDGSTDGSELIVKDCTDSRVRLIHQANAGPGAARNRGVTLANSPLLAFLDADDEWLPTFLERNVALLEQHGPEVATISSGYILNQASISTVPMWQKRQLHDGVYRVDCTMAPLFVVHLLAFLTPPSTIVRTEMVRRAKGFFSEGRCLYGEDSYLWLKVLLNAPVLVNLEPLLRVHSEASDLSHQRSGPRPIEPLLTHPEGLQQACPEQLQELLRQVLAIRAIKTACMLSYWGRWSQARELLRRFCTWSDWRLHRFLVAQIAATPLGAVIGHMLRAMRSCKFYSFADFP